jgi:hypothetical protein
LERGARNLTSAPIVTVVCLKAPTRGSGRAARRNSHALLSDKAMTRMETMASEWTPEMRTSAQEAAASAFNKVHQVGSAVYYRNDHNKIIETKTRTEASVLGGHTAVVWLEDVRGCVDINRVSPRQGT